MHVTIADVNGNVYDSDVLSREEMLAEVGGDEEQMKDTMIEVVSMFHKLGSSDLNYLSITVEGVKRTFNPRNIVWIEIHGLEEFGLDA